MGAIDRGLLRAFEKATESKVGVFLNLKHPKPGPRHIFLESNGKQSWRVFELEAAEIFLESNGKQSSVKKTSFWKATESKVGVFLNLR